MVGKLSGKSTGLLVHVSADGSVNHREGIAGVQLTSLRLVSIGIPVRGLMPLIFRAGFSSSVKPQGDGLSDRAKSGSH